MLRSLVMSEFALVGMHLGPFGLGHLCFAWRRVPPGGRVLMFDRAWTVGALRFELSNWLRLGLVRRIWPYWWLVRCFNRMCLGLAAHLGISGRVLVMLLGEFAPLRFIRIVRSRELLLVARQRSRRRGARAVPVLPIVMAV